APMNVREYLPEDMAISGIDFSPDGRMISFLWTDGDEDRAVYGIPVDGGTYRKLATVDGAAVRSYAWSPDGSHMHLLVGPDEDSAREKESKAGFNSVVYEEEDRLNRLFRARIGAEPDAEPQEVSVPGYVTSFQIADNARIGVIETAPSTQIDDQYTSKKVNILDMATGEIRMVVETTGKIDDVEISPDASQLALIAAVDMNDPAATTLHFVDTATGAITPHRAGEPEAVVDVEYMPDGRLVAAVHVGVQSVLRIHNRDGSLAREIDPGALIITDVEVGGNTVAVEANAPRHPGELFKLDGNSFTRWTQHNPWLSEIDFGEQRTFRFTARDGQEVEGVLIEPVGGAPRGGAPLILNVHGGPEAHDSNGWQTAYSKPGHVAAGQGYAVFLPNYRGSTGYGTAFS
ncbi:MAG: S9 family peptidase, partial [Rhodobacteraceae bacterium]